MQTPCCARTLACCAETRLGVGWGKGRAQPGARARPLAGRGLAPREFAVILSRQVWCRLSLALQPRRLLSNLPGIDDELERIRILILLHELEVDQPLGVSHGGAALKSRSRRLKQRRCEFVFAIAG